MYRQVKLDNSPHLDRWFWADELGETKETCRITIGGADGSELYLDVTCDYEGMGKFIVQITGKPKNLKEHNPNGLPLLIAGAFAKGLGYGQSNTTVDLNGRPVIPLKK